MRAGPVLLYVVGVAIFCAMDSAMKKLVETNPAVMATFWRYLAATVFAIPFWLRAGRPRVTADMLPVHLLRGVVLAASAFAFFWSLKILPLAQAITIAFIAPLLIPPIASAILKEHMKGGSLVAGLIGFAGVIVAVGVNPDDWSSGQLLGVAAVLFSALTYALTVVLMRMRAQLDGPAIVSLLGAGIPALVLAVPMLLLVPPDALLPDAQGWLLVLAAGITGAMALQCLARAYAVAEAQTLAPFEYTALLWAALFGWIFFAEPVSPRTWAGAFIIGGACLWQARRARTVPALP